MILSLLLYKTGYPLLKKTLAAIACAVIFFQCSSVSGETEVAEDSLQYYPPTPAQLPKDSFRYYYRIINAYFDSTLFPSGFNGGVLVAKNGAVIYERYRGLVDLRGTDSMNAHTPIHIASTSKTFTAVAILRLVQEGKLSLSDTLQQFFPTLPYQGITVRMLLNHRSGLPNYVHFMDHVDWDKKRWVLNEDMLRVLCSGETKKSYPPDRHFSYSNTNYVLLAMIIEKVTGLPYPVYMKQKFFGPLGMQDTYVFTLADTLRATPSFTGTGTYWTYDFLDATYGDKNIYSTPRDLLKWDQALYTDQVINPTLRDSAFIPYSHERPSIHNYGLGFRLQLLPNGKKVVYHFGKWHGFNAAFARLMDEKATIIVLGNRFNRNIYRSAMRAYDLFGPYFQDSTQTEE